MHRYLRAPVFWAFLALLAVPYAEAADCTVAMEPLGGVAGAPDVATEHCAVPGGGTIKVRKLMKIATRRQ